MKLITERLHLREFQDSDLSAFRSLEMHPETYRYESATPGEAEIYEYILKAQHGAREFPRRRYRFAITCQPDEEVRGRVTLSLLNDSINEWEIGWAVHPDEWGKGIATEAARRLIEFAFEDLHAHRVVAFCHTLNKASIMVMEKLNMTCEGRLRETRKWEEEWSDEFVFAILERDWFKIIDQSHE